MNKTFSPPSIGTVYHPEKEKCFRFDADRIQVISLWPKPSAWVKSDEHPYWKRFRPDIKIPAGRIENRIQELFRPPDIEGEQLLLPLETPAEKSMRLKRLHRLQFYAKIPQEVRTVVSSFNTRQFHLLSMIARCGHAALDLAVSNPALAYMLASNWVFHKPAVNKPLRSARALLKPHKKQKEILEWLNFPSTNAVRKILRRILPYTITIPRLLYLRQALFAHPETIRILSHIPRINSTVLRIVTDPELSHHVSMKFLFEICFLRREDLTPESAFMLQESVDISKGLNDMGKKIPLIHSRKMLSNCHSDLLHAYEQIMMTGRSTDYYKIKLPHPPVEGTDTIIPLTSVGEIKHESFIQNNCADKYIKKIQINNIYLYKVLSPERCTLSLAKYQHKWRIDQLEKSSNRPASEHTKRIVALWLATHQV